MYKCEVKKPMTLTVEPGSQVILSAAQYRAAKDYVSLLENMSSETEKYSDMSKNELIKIATDKGLELPVRATKAQLVELLGK